MPHSPRCAARYSATAALLLLVAPAGLAPNSPANTCSWVSLEQALLPKAPAPYGVKHLIKGLCAKQLRDMMDDLNTELGRRKAARMGAFLGT